MTVIHFCHTLLTMDLTKWRVIFDAHAGKHGFTKEQIVDAFIEATRIESYAQTDGKMVKFSGPCHGDALVPELEAIIKIKPRERIVVIYHAQSLTDVFWNN